MQSHFCPTPTSFSTQIWPRFVAKTFGQFNPKKPRWRLCLGNHHCLTLHMYTLYYSHFDMWTAGYLSSQSQLCKTCPLYTQVYQKGHQFSFLKLLYWTKFVLGDFGNILALAFTCWGVHMVHFWEGIGISTLYLRTFQESKTSNHHI